MLRYYFSSVCRKYVSRHRSTSSDHERRRTDQLTERLSCAHAPNDELATAQACHHLVVLEDGRALRLRVEREDVRVVLVVVVDGEVEDEEVGVSVERVLEASDDVSVVT